MDLTKHCGDHFVIYTYIMLYILNYVSYSSMKLGEKIVDKVGKLIN